MIRIGFAAALLVAAPALAAAQTGTAGSAASRDSARGRMEGETGRTTSDRPTRSSGRGGTRGGMRAGCTARRG